MSCCDPGNACRACWELAGEDVQPRQPIRGSAFVTADVPETFGELERNEVSGELVDGRSVS